MIALERVHCNGEYLPEVMTVGYPTTEMLFSIGQQECAVSCDASQNCITPKGNNSLNFSLARDQVMHLETMANLGSSPYVDVGDNIVFIPTVQIILYTTCIYEVCFNTTGLEFAVETLKSFILSMALIDNHLTVETAVYLSRLEVEFQVCSLIVFQMYNSYCQLYEFYLDFRQKSWGLGRE